MARSEQNNIPASAQVPVGTLEGILASKLFSNFGFPIFRRVARVNPLNVYYHLVTDRPVPHVDALYRFRSVREFSLDLELLLRWYVPISLEQFLAHLVGRGGLPPNAVLLSFDDGLSECFHVIAPLLKAKGIPGTFFLCSAFVDNRELSYDHKKCLLAGEWGRKQFSAGVAREVQALLGAGEMSRAEVGRHLLAVKYERRGVLDAVARVLEVDFSAYLHQHKPYLTSSQIRAMLADGHAMGAHSIDHPRYSEISFGEQLRQTLESARFVQERFGTPYSAFSFPHSDAGISVSFFDQVLAAGKVDVCFGNRGLLPDRVPRNVQRTSMEKTWMPAAAILGKAYTRRFIKKLRGQDLLERKYCHTLELPLRQGTNCPVS